ncbi:hypothetical protein RHRU231_450093 [Rhodococcus ruber]|uniref:Uncharacterized protein n=1 Tax=Rhodococcus ruber TaxID=1830 RepID=A0A098BMI2_9NOCA|nr:hypothetical protein RHRU231_450093 [Rhodococcus ruber]
MFECRGGAPGWRAAPVLFVVRRLLALVVARRVVSGVGNSSFPGVRFGGVWLCATEYE